MMQAEPALRRDGVIAAESSVNREVSGNQTVFEDVAATVGKMALAGKALERATERFGPGSTATARCAR